MTQTQRNTQYITFKFFTTPDPAHSVKAAASADGKPRIRLTASTTALDLHGDTFTEKALKRMEESAAGTTIFLNHKGQVPEDVFGAVERAWIEKQADGVLALNYDVLVESANPRAATTFDQIMGGVVTLGASVTVAVLEKQSQRTGRGMVIDDVEYIECSIVGRPANPRTWVQYARKALDEAPAEEQVSTVAAPEGAPVSQDTSLTTTTAKAAAGEAEAQPSVPASLTAADARTLIATEMKPGTDPATIFSKGLFAEAMARVKFSPYQLFDQMQTVVYKLMRLRRANMDAGLTDDFDYAGAIEEAVFEFAPMLLDSYSSMLGLDAPANATEVSAYSLELTRGLELVAKSAEKVEGADEAMKMVQGVHDIAVKLRAKCDGKHRCNRCYYKNKSAAGAPTGDSAAAAEAELVSTNTQLSTERETLSKQLDDARSEAATWKAIASTSMTVLQKFAKEPLPRAGAQ